MIDTILWWTGATVFGVAGVVALAGGLYFSADKALKWFGLTWKIVLAVAFNDTIGRIVESGEPDDFAHARRLLEERIREAMKRHKRPGRQVDP